MVNECQHKRGGSTNVDGKCFLLTSFFSDFQNFLRTQTGNTTTVNIIISTVDYLLRLQVTQTA